MATKAWAGNVLERRLTRAQVLKDLFHGGISLSVPGGGPSGERVEAQRRILPVAIAAPCYLRRSLGAEWGCVALSGCWAKWYPAPAAQAIPSEEATRRAVRGR